MPSVHFLSNFNDGWVLIRELPKFYYGNGDFVAPIGEDGELIPGDFTVDVVTAEGEVLALPLQRTLAGLYCESLNLHLNLGTVAMPYKGKFKHPDLEHCLCYLEVDSKALDNLLPRVLIGLDPFKEGNYAHSV